jgi:peptidoglycan/xylan/chitin deacetylase (PgdA/CDA1 family)
VTHVPVARSMRLSRADRPMAAVHVDLDGARHIYRAHGWTYHGADDRLFETGLRGALDALEQAGVRATLFVIAEDMLDGRKRKMVRSAADNGHEIASHSLTHRRLTRLSRAEQRAEISESRCRLAADLGTPVRGFRAPGFHVDERCLELIAEAGYDYDSSTLLPRRRWQPLAAARPIVELPVPTFRRVGLPFHPSYALAVGDWYFNAGVRAFAQTDAPFVLLFHLTDFAEPLPHAEAPTFSQRLFTLSHLGADRKRARSAAMLALVRSRFTITTTTSLIETARISQAGRES